MTACICLDVDICATPVVTSVLSVGAKLSKHFSTLGLMSRIFMSIILIAETKKMRKANDEYL